MSAPANDRAEWANVWTHAPGIAFSLYALHDLWVHARAQATPWHLGGALVFGFSLLAVYTASTAYHFAAPGPRKQRLQKLDHVAIFALIAGTYTPFLLLNLRSNGGPMFLAGIWTVTLGGMAWKVICADCAPRLSTGLYFALGWAILVLIGRLDAAMPDGGIRWLMAGGAAYSLGVVFYLWERLPYHHAVWHVLVLVGSACHWVAVNSYSLVCSV